MGRGKMHYGWVVIFMGLLTTIAAHGFGRMAYTIILPAMKDGLQLDYTQLGLLGTGNFIGYLTMAIIGGFLAARFGTRIVITLALVLMGITMVLTGLAENFGFAFGMRLMTGLGNGAAYVPAMALGSAWFSMERRGFATGIVSGGIGAGTLISGLVVPPILQAFGPEGWRMSWYILGGAVLVISGVVFLFIRSRPEDKGLSPIGVQKKDDRAAASGIQSKVSSLDWTRIYKMPGLVPGPRLLFLWPVLYHLYGLFRRLSGQGNRPIPGMGRHVMGHGRRIERFLRRHLGKHLRPAGEKPGGGPGLPGPGHLLYYLCAG